VTTVARGFVTCQDGDVNHVFVSGNPALDFVGTLKWRRSDPEELLAEPSALADWVAESGLVSCPVEVSDAELLVARELREALYLVVEAAASGSPLPGDALATVNDFAAAPPVTPELRESSVAYVGQLPAVLSSVARSAIDALSDSRAGDILVLKECGREECTRIFLDRSRGHRRTWCGMDECGNRINAAAYRRRKNVRTTQR
jgi:predicted RNA-binding Zn ribbon-like protein